MTTNEELERLAREANDFVPETEGETWFCPEHLTKDDRFAPEDAAFIAAADPATILALLAERAELLAAVERMRGEMAGMEARLRRWEPRPSTDMSQILTGAALTTGEATATEQGERG